MADKGSGDGLMGWLIGGLLVGVVVLGLVVAGYYVGYDRGKDAAPSSTAQTTSSGHDDGHDRADDHGRGRPEGSGQGGVRVRRLRRLPHARRRRSDRNGRPEPRRRQAEPPTRDRQGHERQGSHAVFQGTTRCCPDPGSRDVRLPGRRRRLSRERRAAGLVTSAGWSATVRILLTGTTGVLGRALLPHLSSHHAVGLTRFPRSAIGRRRSAPTTRLRCLRPLPARESCVRARPEIVVNLLRQRGCRSGRCRAARASSADSIRSQERGGLRRPRFGCTAGLNRQ